MRLCIGAAAAEGPDAETISLNFDAAVNLIGFHSHGQRTVVSSFGRNQVLHLAFELFHNNHHQLR